MCELLLRTARGRAVGLRTGSIPHHLAGANAPLYYLAAGSPLVYLGGVQANQIVSSLQALICRRIASDLQPPGQQLRTSTRPISPATVLGWSLGSAIRARGSDALIRIGSGPHDDESRLSYSSCPSYG